jgi:hypothetical protein
MKPQEHCPLCLAKLRLVTAIHLHYECGNTFRHIEGNPREEAFEVRSERCRPRCGVCGDPLPHHITQCASSLRSRLQEC